MAACDNNRFRGKKYGINYSKERKVLGACHGWLNRKWLPNFKQSLQRKGRNRGGCHGQIQ